MKIESMNIDHVSFLFVKIFYFKNKNFDYIVCWIDGKCKPFKSLISQMVRKYSLNNLLFVAKKTWTE